MLHRMQDIVPKWAQLELFLLNILHSMQDI
jgi:hypothetical protein